jgi:thiamine biosynthesis lipoprotein
MKEKPPECARFDLARHSFTPEAYHFAHSAMATTFEIYCTHADARYAGQAARAAFDLIDRLELELSRFIENSDISRINSLSPGQSTQVSPWTMECLQTARRIYMETGGAFDVSIGSGFDTLEFAPDEMTVRATATGVSLDLGGIGKGYAVDCVAELLEEWDVTRALLHGGFSSVLALEPPAERNGWPLTFSVPGPGNKEVLARISARQQAFSASGVEKGQHIVDARSGQPVQGRLAAWVSLPRVDARPSEMLVDADRALPAAALADALSTAFMILSTEEVAALCDRWRGLEAWLITKRAENEPDVPVLIHLPVS